MDIKPEILKVEGIDSATVPGLHVKNEIIYQLEPSHQPQPLRRDNIKVYYNDNMHSTPLQLTNPKTNLFVTEHEQTFPSSKQMMHSPKYETPKIRMKSIYSPLKQNQSQQITHPQQIFLTNPNNTIISPSSHPQHQSHQHQILSPDRSGVEHNTVQVITPNSNYSPHQWTTQEVPVVPQQIASPSILEQSISAEILSGQTLTSEAIFIPETTSVLDASTGEYGVISTSSINVIPVMTPNGIVLVAANNALTNTSNPLNPNSQTGTSISSEISNLSTPQQISPPTASRNYTKQRSTKKATNTNPQQSSPQPQLIPQEIISSNSPNVIYTANGPVLVLNESRVHPQITETTSPVLKQEQEEKLPEKGTVIEEPPKAIYQPRVYNDINENSTNYNSRKKSSHNSRGSAAVPAFDAEIDLDAALKIFKIYK